MPELIDRQSALSVCKEYGWIDDEDFIEGYNTAIIDIREAIKELPTIEAEPVRHGRWLPCLMLKFRYECGCCGEPSNYPPPYCPNCGARMDGGADNAESD